MQKADYRDQGTEREEQIQAQSRGNFLYVSLSMGCEEAINIHSLQGCISVPLFVTKMNPPCYGQNVWISCLAFTKTKHRDNNKKNTQKNHTHITDTQKTQTANPPNPPQLPLKGKTKPQKSNTPHPD